MTKDYWPWHLLKSKIDSSKRRIFFHEREIWWCSLGVNVGAEQDGTGINFDRPVVIIKTFNQGVCLILSLTGKKKLGKHYFYIGLINGRDNTAVLSQVRLVDSKRLIRKLTTLDESTFIKLKAALQAALFS